MLYKVIILMSSNKFVNSDERERRVHVLKRISFSLKKIIILTCLNYTWFWNKYWNRILNRKNNYLLTRDDPQVYLTPKKKIFPILTITCLMFIDDGSQHITERTKSVKYTEGSLFRNATCICNHCNHISYVCIYLMNYDHFSIHVRYCAFIHLLKSIKIDI